MAKSKLNVQLGLDISAFERAIIRASNKMEQFGKRMEGIGRDLTTRLSLPLAGVGAAAVAAFADFERLSLGLNAVMGSAEAAEAEMAKLQESAKLPGLGFQEAVRGSIRLQAVGLSADEARGTLEAFGAAIAATGGSAQNLDSVQYQLTQMISKNRILQEDFGILQENVPLLGKAVQNAFGTANIEKIRATGISAEEFNRRIVAALQALPEVQAAAGGLGNAFDNFKDSLNFSLVALGETINETLNLEGILNAVSNAVQGLVNLFKSFSPTTQKVIVVIAALAAAIGPLLFAIGAITKVIPLLVSGFTVLKGAAIALATPLALKLVVFTAIAYMVGFLYKRFETFRRAVNGLAKAFIALASFAKNAFVALLDGFSKLTSGDFAGAAESFRKGLQLFNPIEFGKQFIEGFAKGFEDNTDYIDKGIEGLKSRIRGAVKDFTPTITPEITAPETGGGGGGEGRKVPILLQPNAQQQQKVFDKIEQDALARFRKPKAVLQPFEFEGKDPVKETETVLADYSKAIADADAKARIFGTDTQTLLQEKLNITSGILSEGVEKFGENSLIVETLTGQYNSLAESLDAVAERQTLIAKYQEIVGKVFDLTASKINESGLSIKTILSSVVDAVRSAVVEFVRLKIVEAVASFVADSFKKFGVLGVALGAAAGAVVGGVFTGAINAIAPPRLAQGGLATKETLAVVGDNPSGKEAIIPFERMGEFLDMAGGGAMRLVGQFEVRGQDLILVLDRATQQKLRVR
jgi:tape measure domain-containing protein